MICLNLFLSLHKKFLKVFAIQKPKVKEKQKKRKILC